MLAEVTALRESVGAQVSELTGQIRRVEGQVGAAIEDVSGDVQRVRLALSGAHKDVVAGLAVGSAQNTAIHGSIKAVAEAQGQGEKIMPLPQPHKAISVSPGNSPQQPLQRKPPRKKKGGSGSVSFAQLPPSVTEVQMAPAPGSEEATQP